jgi:hypothetical protein
VSTNERRRERYAKDETYRERRLRAVRERRQQIQKERDRLKRLRGWEPIHSAPENEWIILYDPYVFWPVVATLKDGQWRGVHYEGAIRPTHWRRLLEVPLP